MPPPLAFVLDLVGDCADPRPPFVARAERRSTGPVLCVTPTRPDAERLVDDLHLFLGEPAPLVSVEQRRPTPYARLFPDREMSMFDEGADDPDRLLVLEELARGQPIVVVAPLLAVLQAAADPESLRPLILRRGQSIARSAADEWLTRRGYVAASEVRVAGQYVDRGAIFDLFPSTGHALRLELDGDVLVDLRAFDPDTQRSIARLESAAVLRMREPEGVLTLLQAFPKDTPVLLCGAEEIRRQLETMTEMRIGGKFSAYRDIPILGKKSPWEAFEGSLDGHPIERMDGEETSLPRFAGRLGELAAHISASEIPIVAVSAQARRLRASLARRGVKDVRVVEGVLSGGLDLDSICIYSDREIFGTTRSARPARGMRIAAEGLDEGDLVVHAERGIGWFQNLTPVEVEGRRRDMLSIVYAKENRLMVPVDQIDRIHKYVGADDRMPKPTRLDRPGWRKTLKAVERDVDLIAQALRHAERERAKRRARAFGPDRPEQEELEAAFPYDDTPDQARAAEEIKRDMEREIPMDRLLCGDVGYGKTEIAVRAAFKAVLEGAQVAVLVPTTVLAQQHEETFRARTAPFGVRVGILTAESGAEEVAAVSRGEVSIVIGTHRLLGEDVEIPRLGLLIVDEEQLFGVAHKERLRQMARAVHTLSMSATPIPRTMQLALIGARDVSVLETPPEARRPVRTYLLEDSREMVRAAITRELERGGQVFYLHNRIQGLERLGREVRRLVPRARMATAHGQLGPAELDRVLAGFLGGEQDVLICTTIIESGVDMPNVNSIIVRDAQNFGLGQLYQMRGRVGRSDRQAWCYLLHPAARGLSPKAAARLETMRAMTAPGSGYGVALRDLQIRGAGNLLGAEQTGQIGRIGFALYCRLLESALGRKRAPSLRLPEIEGDAYLPEDYIREPSQRIEVYRRLGEAGLEEALRDRYGPLPVPVRALIEAASAGSGS